MENPAPCLSFENTSPYYTINLPNYLFFIHFLNCQQFDTKIYANRKSVETNKT